MKLGMNVTQNMVAATLAVAGLLVAAMPAQAAMDWKACSKEIAQYCKDVKGDDKIYACLETHDADLSKDCQVPHGKYEADNGIKK